jgi:hypothetical protein
VDAPIDDHAVDGDADLPRVEELAEHRDVDCAIEVGVIEHDEGRVAAELEDRALDMLTRGRGDPPPNLRAAGERHHPRHGMRNEDLPISSPAPATTLSTPGGRPASS